jgi:hypothetical protein
VLDAEHILYIDKDTPVTVCDLITRAFNLDTAETFDDDLTEICDPMEPDDREGECRPCAQAFLRERKVISFAHGTPQEYILATDSEFMAIWQELTQPLRDDRDGTLGRLLAMDKDSILEPESVRLFLALTLADDDTAADTIAQVTERAKSLRVKGKWLSGHDRCTER